MPSGVHSFLVWYGTNFTINALLTTLFTEFFEFTGLDAFTSDLRGHDHGQARGSLQPVRAIPAQRP